MNNTKRILFGSAALAIAGAAFIMKDTSKSVYQADSKMIETANAHNGSAQYLFDRRKNLNTGTISVEELESARAQATAIKNSGERALDITWTERGPDNVGGRTRAIIFDKDTPSTMFTGGVGGGVWFSTTSGQSWWQIDPQASGLTNINVASLTQDSEGYLYVGTGEGFYQNTGDGTGGLEGAGIFVSEAPTSSYASLADVVFVQRGWTTTTDKTTFVNVNKMAADPSTGRVYASTKRGLRYTDDKGVTWVNPLLLGNNPLNSVSYDVEVASNGAVYAVAGNKLYYLFPQGADDDWEQLTGITAGATRLDIAVSPEDPNYVYIIEIGSDRFMRSAGRSTDGGQTWEDIGEGGSELFSPFGDPVGGSAQGFYDLALGVYAGNKDKIMVGGVELWSYEYGQGWERIGSEFYYPGNTHYVHSDKHVVAFHPTNPNTAYVTSDGGVAVTYDEGETFQSMNRQYNVTQFYSVATDIYDNVIGGTQDNSNHFLPKNNMSSIEMFSGDGASTAISYLNPDAYFVSSQYGNLGRSPNAGSSFSAGESFVSDLDLDATNLGGAYDYASFVAPFSLWEDGNMENSVDSALFVADTDYSSGDVITVQSNVPSYSMEYTLTEDLDADSSILVQDTYQTKFFVGLATGVWMTTQAIDFSLTPSWIHLTDVGSNVEQLAHSADGDVVYYADASARLYRISNLNMVTDSVSGDHNSPENVVDVQQIGSWGQSITSIAVDPHDNEHIVVTLGNYGGSAYVYESTTAATTAATSGNFTSIHANLPDAPVYSSLISYDDSDVILVGTEFGVYAQDGGSTWVEENTGMDPVACFMMIQQTIPGAQNFGKVYVATHGRGIFETSALVGMADEEESNNGEVINYNAVNVYPNPTSDVANIELDLKTAESYNVNVFDINGRLVQSTKYSSTIGKQIVSVDLKGLAEGNYVVKMIAKSTVNYAKVTVRK